MPSDLHSPSHARSLTLGAAVSIVRTENVQQRAPHLIGRTGTIAEVPVHPNTWFRVEFEPGSRHTFRPSALRLVTDTFPLPSADEAAALSPEDPSDGLDGRGRSRRSRKDMDSNAAAPGVKHADKAPVAAPTPPVTRKAIDDTLLSTVDADVWINKMVRIKGGRFLGHTGRVLRSGNGWVQLQTAMGEVAKRAYELHLLPPEEQDQEPSGPNEEKGRKRRGGPDGLGSTSSSKTRKAKTEAAPTPEFAIPNGVTAGFASVGPLATADTAGIVLPKPRTSSAGRTRRTNQRHQGSAAAARIAESRAALDRYQEHIRKHLERQMDKAKERPNLNWWLKEFQADNTALADTEEDGAEPIFDLGPPCCDHCGVDLAAPFGKCCNEACAFSPLDVRTRNAARAFLDPSAPAPKASRVSSNADVGILDTFLIDAPTQWLDARRRQAVAATVKASPKGKKGRGKGKNKMPPVSDDHRDPLLYRWRCTQTPPKSPPQDLGTGTQLQLPTRPSPMPRPRPSPPLAGAPPAANARPLPTHAMTLDKGPQGMHGLANGPALGTLEGVGM